MCMTSLSVWLISYHSNMVSSGYELKTPNSSNRTSHSMSRCLLFVLGGLKKFIHRWKCKRADSSDFRDKIWEKQYFIHCFISLQLLRYLKHTVINLMPEKSRDFCIFSQRKCFCINPRQSSRLEQLHKGTQIQIRFRWGKLGTTLYTL